MGTMGAANILYEAVLGVALADKGGSVLHWLAEQVLGAGYAGVCVAVAYFLPLVVLVRAAIYVDRSLLCTEPLGFPSIAAIRRVLRWKHRLMVMFPLLLFPIHTLLLPAFARDLLGCKGQQAIQSRALWIGGRSSCEAQTSTSPPHVGNEPAMLQLDFMPVVDSGTHPPFPSLPPPPSGIAEPIKPPYPPPPARPPIPIPAAVGLANAPMVLAPSLKSSTTPNADAGVSDAEGECSAPISNATSPIECVKDPTRELDLYTGLFFSLIKALDDGVQPEGSIIRLPKAEPVRPLPKIEFLPGLLGAVFDEDEALAMSGALMNQVFDQYMQSPTLHPIVDTNMPWWEGGWDAPHPTFGATTGGLTTVDNVTSPTPGGAGDGLDLGRQRSVAIDVLIRRVMRRLAGESMPEPASASAVSYDYGDSLASIDEGLAQIAFGGLAAHVLRKLDAVEVASQETKDGRQSHATPCNHVPRAPVGSTFVSDFTWMCTLGVRPGFERYGAAAYFNEHAQLIAIWWSHGQAMLTQVDGERWIHAAWAYRCSALTGVTLRDHLVGTHLVVANALVTATRDEMSSGHPIRRLLKPFTYRTVVVNRAARPLLCTQYSLLHRSVALDAHGLAMAFNESVRDVRNGFDPLDKHAILDHKTVVTSQGDEALTPFAADATRFRAAIQSYVAAYINIYYPTDSTDLTERAAMSASLGEVSRKETLIHGSCPMLEPGSPCADTQLGAWWERLRSEFPLLAPLCAPPTGTCPSSSNGCSSNGAANIGPHDSTSPRWQLIELLTSFVFHVSAVHTHVGSAFEMVKDPRFSGSKIRPQQHLSDVQAAVQALSIALVTGYKQPMIVNSFAHLLLRDKHLNRTKAIQRAWQDELLAVSDRVRQLNVHRRFRIAAFDPRIVGSSVAI
mmetsp:Transcript_18325/g.51595  ORF Transcript_18325/g.51595 Transcript_18325/m.51595 type:complete len:900 (+) Transcript_18325:2459-5158(+)